MRLPSIWCRSLSYSLLASLVSLAVVGAEPSRADDPIRALQDDAIARKDEKIPRAYHFGPQGAGDRYSDSTGHSNRLIPVYAFGRKVDLGSVTGPNSRYRDAEKLKELYGVVPPFTRHPAADYADQSDLYRVQKEAVERGVKHLFIVWFDGMDWQTTRAAAIAKTGKIYDEGKGTGLNFQDETAEGSAQFGYYVTSPIRNTTSRMVDTQTVTHEARGLLGGYDPLIAGFTPWAPGPFDAIAPTYIKGGPTKDVVGSPLEIKPETAELAEEQIGRFLRDSAKGSGVKALGRVQHAVTDSAPSAAEFASGVKSYNDSVNVADDGKFVPTLFNQLQRDRGWKVGTVTSVPFNHASPSAMYAHNVDRNDYQDLAREMLGLESIAQQTGKAPKLPGLDVVMGTGNGQNGTEASLKKSQGANAVAGNTFITDADLKTINVSNGGKYVVAKTTSGRNGAHLLQVAAEQAAARGQRLFGFFGSLHGHLPFRTADGRYDPARGIGGVAEKYPAAELDENPTLADMTRSALTVLAAKPDQPFALFVEAGDVDFALHDNNLDNAIGAVHSGEMAIDVILDWIKTHSNWDDSALIVSADHGHYLVVDDPKALVPPATK